MKNLFEDMQKIVDNNMENYKSDFNLDKDFILKSEKNEFYWYVRRSGTDIFDIDNINFINSEDYTIAKYYLYSEDLHIFKIKVENRTKDEVLGMIEPINKKTFKKILDEPKDIKGVIAKITLNNVTVIEGEYTGDDNQEILYRVLRENNKTIDDLKSYKVVKYIG